MQFQAWLKAGPPFHADHSAGDHVQGKCGGYDVAKAIAAMKRKHLACAKREVTNKEYFQQMRVPVLDYVMSVYAAHKASTSITVSSMLNKDLGKLVRTIGPKYPRLDYTELERLMPDE